MRWNDIPFDPARATLRQFAGLCLVVFGGMALWQALVRGHTGLAIFLALLALTIGPVGLARPEWVRWIYVGWMVLAFPIGWTVSQVLLALMFYGLFVPIGSDIQADRPRLDAPHSPAHIDIVLGTQGDTERPASLFQAILK